MSKEQLSQLTNNYVWSNVKSFEVGPRREITLFMRLWRSDVLNRNDHDWKQNRQPATIVPVRFGGVENLEEVEAFFENLLTETTKIGGDQLVYKFDYDWKQESKPNKIHFLIYFENSGDTIIIRCQNIAEREAFSDSEN